MARKHTNHKAIVVRHADERKSVDERHPHIIEFTLLLVAGTVSLPIGEVLAHVVKVYLGIG